MRNKIPIIIFIIILDLVVLPVFLFNLIKVIESRDLFFGTLNTLKLLESGPQIIFASFLSSEVFRKMWLMCQPLVGVFFIAFFKKNEVKGEKIIPESAGKGEYGTSRFLTRKEIDKKFTLCTYPGLIEKGGVVLGSEFVGKKHKFWLDAEDTQVLLIGSTGSGKTLRIIMPSIWVMAEAGESMVLTDPKGELYQKTSGFLENMGYKIIMLDFRNLKKSKNFWNPLQPVIDAVEEKDNSLASERAWDIANMIVHQRPIFNTDPIWTDGEESVIASLILANCLGAEKLEQRNMASVYSMLYLLGKPSPYNDNEIPLNDYIDNLPKTHPAQAAFGTANLAPYRTRASFFTGAASKLKLWADPSIAYVTSKQDHDLRSIGYEKTAAFLIIPDEKSTTQFLASLYIDQVYQVLVEEANKNQGKLLKRVNFLLDEFGNLPKIKDFDKKITVARSRNIRFLLAIQGLDQIKAIYKDVANTITGNCRIWIYLLTADNETARILSQKVGQYTIKTKSFSSSKRSNDISEGSSTGLTGRALLMPDEILRWDVLYKLKSLVIKAGDYPAIFNSPFLSDTPIESEFKKYQNVRKEVEKTNDINIENLIWVPKIKKDSSEIEKQRNEISLEEELDIL